MVGETRPESVGVRFGAYIDELREFLKSRDVRFGTPEDLVSFADRVSEVGPFQDEMASMVRSIVYREDERLGRGELLEIVSVAVGGPEVEGAAQEMQGSVRRIFVFLNTALRQRREEATDLPVSPKPASTGSEVTAGDILAATKAARAAAAAQEANTTSSAKSQPEERRETMPVLRAEPQGNAVLFRAVSMAAEEEADAPRRDEMRRKIMRQQWLVPAVAAALAVVGVGIYIMRPATGHNADAQKNVAGLSSSQAGTDVGSCVAPMAAGVTRAGLDERARWAHSLLDQKLYDAALPELRDIARLDPGFPGVQLDESDALLNLKRPDEARAAVDGQIAVSECLAKLPPAALDAYCSAQYTANTRGDCRPQLAHLRQSAQLQAALVHLELGHRFGPDGNVNPAAAELRSEGASEKAAASPTKPTLSAALPKPHRTAPVPTVAHVEPDVTRAPAPRPASRPAPRQTNSDDTLVHGEGTDASYGAYQKPQ